MSSRIYKTLSRNDTGETHSHQSGITIPKVVAKTDIFPEMPKDILNPRTDIIFYDEEGVSWTFQYIFYNDIFFGKPIGKGHNEYRLTCVREYIKKYNITSGNEIWFEIDENNVRHIGYIEKESMNKLENKTKVIELSSGWHIINF